MKILQYRFIIARFTFGIADALLTHHRRGKGAEVQTHNNIFYPATGLLDDSRFVIRVHANTCNYIQFEGE